jgi:DNA polymerase III gamma/tau subunit
MSISHNKQWNFLKEKFESGQLSHSYLISGNLGIGKLDFTKRFCDFIGCKFPDLMVVI